MSRHLVTLHCGAQIWAVNRGQMFCNRRCAAFFVTRRPDAKKRSRTASPATSENMRVYTLDSSDPIWDTARRHRTRKGYILLHAYDSNLKVTISRMEHIVVWERRHGPLPKGSVIHHLNEQPDDNDPGNLVALPIRLHFELHVQLRQLAQQYIGIAYSVRRHALAEEFVKRSTELATLRRHWHAEE